MGWRVAGECVEDTAAAKLAIEAMYPRQEVQYIYDFYSWQVAAPFTGGDANLVGSLVLSWTTKNYYTGQMYAGLYAYARPCTYVAPAAASGGGGSAGAGDFAGVAVQDVAIALGLTLCFVLGILSGKLR